MGTVVYKYEMPVQHGVVEVTMPLGAEITSVGFQDRRLCVWARVDPEQPDQARTVLVALTGHPLPDGRWRVIGRADMNSGPFGAPFVAHVFEPAAAT